MFLLLPNQLFYNIDKKKQYVLYEHPIFFTSHEYHIKKLILHVASMRSFYDYCVRQNIAIKYVKYDEKLNDSLITEMYYPCDKNIERQFQHVTMYNSPMWLLTNELIDEYKGPLYFHSFKLYAIKSLKLIDMDKSLDDMNRNRYDKSEYPRIPKLKNKDFQYVEYAKKYIREKKFNYYGKMEDYEYPVTRETAMVFLKDFFVNRLENFGKYQDSIVEDSEGNILYHSFLSSSINIGIITIDEVLKMAYKYKNRVPDNAFEGYVRQLLWREYMRYVYQKHDIINSNNLGLTKSLSKEWYKDDFETGILPVDVCLEKVVRTGYLHHIERLMIILNIFVLMEIKPKDMYKWFMTCFIDAYDWVMLGNVFIFSYSHKGSRKPYISSSNYIMKMSNYKKGDWNEKWDKLYHDFIKKKKEKLKGTVYYKK